VPTYYLRPINTISNTGVALTGAAQVSTAWSDNTDASFGDVSTGDSAEVGLPALTEAPDGEQVVGYRIRVRALTIVSVSNQPPFFASLKLGATTLSQANLFETGPSPAEWVSVPVRAPQEYGRTANMSIRIDAGGANTTRFYEVWLEVLTVRTPRVDLLHPTPGTRICQSPVALFQVAALDTINEPFSQVAAAWMSEEQFLNNQSRLTFADLITNGAQTGSVSSIVGGSVAINTKNDPITSFYTPISADSQFCAIGVQQELAAVQYPAFGNLNGYLEPGRYYLAFFPASLIPGASVELGITGPLIFGPWDVEDTQDEIEGGQLGCGSWRFFLAERDGTLIEEIDGSLRYSVQVDNTSTASFTTGISALSPTCSATLSGAIPWEFQLRAYRDDVLLFAGPIIDITDDTTGTVTLAVKDKAAWLDRRLIFVDILVNNVDAVGLAELLVAGGFERDSVQAPNISSTRAGVAVSRQIRARDLRSVGDALRELGRSGVDFVTVGDTLYLYGVGATVTFGPCSDEALTVKSNRLLGGDSVTIATVRGAGGGPQTAAVSGTAGFTSERVGILQVVTSEPGILDSDSAAASAASRVALLKDGFRSIDATLLAGFPAVAADLIPGRLVDLRIDGWRPLVGKFRIAALNVTASNTGEQFDVTLTEVGEEQ